MAPPKEAPEAQSTSMIPAALNYQELLTKAREYFYKLDPNIIGINIAPGRVKQSKTPNEFALVVYVLQKKPLSELDPAKVIPKEFMGLKTHVFAPLSADAPQPTGDFVKDRAISAYLRAIDWVRIHELAVSLEASPAVASAPNVQDFGDVCVVENDGTLVIDQPTNTGFIKVVDFVRAYKLFRTLHGDDYDFVTFFVDVDSGLPNMGSSGSPMFNDVQGIGLEPRNRRPEFGTSRLQGFHSMRPNVLNFREVMLQEFGHQFAVHVRFYTDPLTGAPKSDHLLDEGPEIRQSHWAKFPQFPLNLPVPHEIDDDKSPMDYGANDWVELPSGEFKRVSLNSDERTYCNMDLYLMGLLGPKEVGEFTLLRNIASIPGSTQFTATPVRLTVQNFIDQEGDRIPNVAVSQKNWRQAFVVLTNDIHKVHDFVDAVDTLRVRWEQKDFPEATKGLGSVDTVLGRRHGSSADFTIVTGRKQGFGSGPGSVNSIEAHTPFEGRARDYTFSCPNVNPNESAVLMFQSRDVDSSKNIITINGINVLGGIPVSPNKDAWNGNVLLIGGGILRPSGNVLHIESRNTSGGSDGDIDAFILDNMVVMYKTR